MSGALSIKEMNGKGQLKNLSRGGLCLLTDQRLTPKECLTLTIPLSRSTLAIPTFAYVRWTRPVRRTARYASGLWFLV
jgi:PilZ domain